MQSTLLTAQPEQWSWMLTQLWSWMWSGMSWILDLQQLVFGFIFDGTPGLAVAEGDSAAAAGRRAPRRACGRPWFPCTRLPFRSGRGYFLTALLMSWWDVGRMAWFYWAGMGRFLFVFAGLDRQPESAPLCG